MYNRDGSCTVWEVECVTPTVTSCHTFHERETAERFIITTYRTMGVKSPQIVCQEVTRRTVIFELAPKSRPL